MERPYPLYTLEGGPDADTSTHYFSTEDYGLGLSMLRFARGPCDAAVLIVHGLTTSSDMFIMPEHYNLVRYLLDNGFTDVWCLDFRMSNRYAYNLTRHRFNMDDIETSVLFMTGENNLVFTDSNIVCHRRLEELVPGRHQLHVFPGYGHQDVFMGDSCHIDIFPRLLDFLNSHRN